MAKKDVITELIAIKMFLDSTTKDEKAKNAIDMAIEALKQPKQKKGKWIDIDTETYTWMIKCDKCGHLRSMMSTNGIYPKFCENCGAKMGEEE